MPGRFVRASGRGRAIRTTFDRVDEGRQPVGDIQRSSLPAVTRTSRTVLLRL
jgi:hypothetical protein